MKLLTIFSSMIFIFISGCNSDSSLTLEEKVEKAFKEKDYTRAVKILEEAVSLDLENQEVHYLLGQAYRLLLFDDGSKINNVNPEFATKASEHFRKVIEISPRYVGRKFIVGPYTKLQGIWSSVGMTYLYRGKIDSATWAFRKGQSEGGFYPAIMEFNKNMMASCENDAIIFTNGDNDTHPMWFLQLVEGYRTDITVVNLSLLNVPWYIKQLKNKYPFGDNNISLNLTDEEIDNLKAQTWTATTFQLPVHNDPLNSDGEIQWVLKPTIKDKIIRVQDRMVLEILKSNNWQRPIYFAITVAPINKIGLDDYLALEGIVYRLKTHKEKISLQRLRNNCFDVYTYDSVYDDHLQYVEEMKGLFQNYRAIFAQLANAYYDAGQLDGAKETLDIMNNKLPENLDSFKIK